jgi:chromosomal replication initiation ATPase DnaA
MTTLYSLSSLLEATRQVYGVGVDAILGACRQKNYVRARHAAIYLARVDLGMTFEAIGAALCRDESTVKHGFWKIRNALEAGIDRYLAAEIARIRQQAALIADLAAVGRDSQFVTG